MVRDCLAQPHVCLTVKRCAAGKRHPTLWRYLGVDARVSVLRLLALVAPLPPSFFCHPPR